MRRRLFNFAFAYFKIVFTFGLNRLHLFCFRCILLDHTSNYAETGCCYKDTHQRTDIVEEAIKYKEYDFIVVVCDSSNLLRNLNFVIQLREINSNIILCLNLIDEAKKNNIVINTKLFYNNFRALVVGRNHTK